MSNEFAQLKDGLITLNDCGLVEVTYPDATDIYVDKQATGANTGENWTDAYVDLQSAFDKFKDSCCSPVHTIHVQGYGKWDKYITTTGSGLYTSFKC